MDRAALCCAERAVCAVHAVLCLQELAQLEYSALAYRPSQMAAAASLLATMYYGQPADLR